MRVCDDGEREGVGEKRATCVWWRVEGGGGREGRWQVTSRGASAACWEASGLQDTTQSPCQTSARSKQATCIMHAGKESQVGQLKKFRL